MSVAVIPPIHIVDPRPLRPARLDPVYGDDFDRPAIQSAWGTQGTAPSSALSLDGSSFGSFAYASLAKGGIQRASAATDQTWQARYGVGGANSSTMIGLFVLNSSNNGFGVCGYNSPDSMAFVGITGGDYNGTFANNGSYGQVFQRSGAVYEAKIVKSGNNWTGYYSYDGKSWVSIGTHSLSATPAKFGVGCFYSGGGGAATIRVDYVDQY